MKDLILFPIRLIYTLYFVILYFLGLTLSFSGTLLLTMMMGKKAHMPIYRFYKAWMAVFFTISGVRMKVYGKEIRDACPPCIVVSNHSTNIDLITAPRMLPLGAKPLAKAEILKMPILGYQFRVMSVTVDRKSKESRERSMKKLRDTLETGIHIFIYPEGTRNRTSAPLKEFYDGAFRIAIETQKPILPAVTVNSRYIWPMGRWYVNPGMVKGIYLPAIDTRGMTEADVPALKQRVYDLMDACIREHDVLFSGRRLGENPDK
ncbi:MAG: 1-acyl-sn-glycerol-3-phosphate acyltransferase [Candidatus Competibacteraceae bacterium]|nr:1-acyl-sn-glycerol-3-phosphate acyltransferase [Candidatus Competibacteraceae bacterium]